MNLIICSFVLLLAQFPFANTINLPAPKSIMDAPLFANNEFLFLTGTTLSIVLGLLLLFRGEKLFRLWMILSGLWLGWQVGHLIVGFAGITGTVSWLLPILLAVTCATLFVFLFRVTIIIAGFSAGVFLGWKFLFALLPENYTIVIALVCGIAGAIIAGIMTEFFINIATALSGAWLTINGIWNLLPADLPRAIFPGVDNPYRITLIILNLLVILLTIAGYQVQLKSSGRFKKKSRRKQSNK